MLSLHDLEDFMDADAVPAEQAEVAAKRQEPSTAVQHNDAADLPSAQDAYLKGVQSLLSALSLARNPDEN